MNEKDKQGKVSSRQLRRRAQLSNLPENLRGRVPIRHVEAVVALTDEQRNALATRLDNGESIVAALDAIRGEEPTLTPTLSAQIPAGSPEELLEIFRKCYPASNSASILAIAASPLFANLRATWSAWRAVEQESGENEMMNIVAAQIALEIFDSMNRKITSSTSLTDAIRRLSIDWPL